MLTIVLLIIAGGAILIGIGAAIGLAIIALCIAIRIAREISQSDWAKTRRMERARRNREKLKGEKHNGK